MDTKTSVVTILLVVVVCLCNCNEQTQAVSSESDQGEQTTTTPESPSEVASDNGFGKSIHWVTHDQGLELLKSGTQLMMLIIHQQWCGACKALKQSLAESKIFAALSTNFIMVNVEGELDGFSGRYSIDGMYYPRIYFIGADGEVAKEVYNRRGNPKYKYYYGLDSEVTDGMNLAMYPDTPSRDQHEEF